MRACLDRHHGVLKDTSAWAVAHCIEQLFMQEFGAPDEHNKGAGAAGSGEEKYLIECRNKEELPMSSCFSIPGRGPISSVAFSADGRLLARAEGNTVVLCCATSAIELRRLWGHSSPVSSATLESRWHQDGQQQRRPNCARVGRDDGDVRVHVVEGA